MATKQQIIEAIEDLPEDATFEDALDRLYLLYKIEIGIAQADAGQKVSQEEAEKIVDKWFE